MTETTPGLEQPGTEQPATDETTDDPAEEKPDREAAKYRRRLRETEAERDRLTEALGVYRRRDAEQAAEAAGLLRGADLFDLGTDLADLLAEDGTVDTGKVNAAAAALLEERPHWRAPKPSLDLGIGSPVTTKGTSWQDVIQGGRVKGR